MSAVCFPVDQLLQRDFHSYDHLRRCHCPSLISASAVRMIARTKRDIQPKEHISWKT